MNYKNIENQQTVGDYPERPDTELSADEKDELALKVKRAVSEMDAWELFAYVDDLDMILMEMSPFAAAELLRAHRELVKREIIKNPEILPRGDA